MKRILAIVMTMVLLVGMSTISFAATTKKAAPSKTPAAPVFKYYDSQYYFQGKGDYLNLSIQKEPKLLSMTHAEYSQDLTFTKVTPGKAVIAGTSVWIFTGSCVLVSTNKQTGEQTTSKPWNTNVTITFKGADTVVAVSMPKAGAGKGENFKGIAGPPGDGY
jgi:hypothetical protein